MVVPGYIGARSVKWLERIELRDVPWDGYFQSTAYRLLARRRRPGAGRGRRRSARWRSSPTCSCPTTARRSPRARSSVRGYAFAGGERRVVRVDVSLDGGATWNQADLGADLGPLGMAAVAGPRRPAAR